MVHQASYRSNAGISHPLQALVGPPPRRVQVMALPEKTETKSPDPEISENLIITYAMGMA
jgi:hypothetical protein